MATLIKKLFIKILKNNDKKEVENILEYLQRFSKDLIRPNITTIFISLIFLITYSATNAGMAWLIKPIVNQVFMFKEIEYVYQIGLGLIGLTLIKSVSQYTYTTLLFKVSTKVISTARKKLYQSFVLQDMDFHHKNSPGKLVSTMMNDINAMNNLATEIPINVGRDFFTFVGLLGLMFYQNHLYASFIVGSIFFIVIPVTIISKKIKQYFKSTNTGFAELTSRLEQSFNGIREVKSYHRESKEQEMVGKIVDNIAKVQLKVNRTSNILPVLMEFLGGLSIGIMLIYAGHQVVYGNADPGTFFSFIASLLIAYQPLKRLTEFSVKIQLGALAIKRYYSFVDSKPQIMELSDAQDLIIDEVASLTFDNISFSYGNDEKALDNISFTINKGQKIALVGRSGGGKSTIINLIDRFYDPQTGHIYINDQNIKNVTIKSLRENIALVSQEVILFDDTLMSNIAYSRDNVSFDDIMHAAKLSSSLSFIEQLPDKFETILGPRGMRLSGGQKQRISIARALLKDAPLLLLDEATSALDTESEKEIQIALDSLMQNKTTLIIAHRLSTILNCDKIFVLDKGKIIEQGTHVELLNKEDGVYKYLYDLQFKQQETIVKYNN